MAIEDTLIIPTILRVILLLLATLFLLDLDKALILIILLVIPLLVMKDRHFQTHMVTVVTGMNHLKVLEAEMMMMMMTTTRTRKVRRVKTRS